MLWRVCCRVMSLLHRPAVLPFPGLGSPASPRPAVVFLTVFYVHPHPDCHLIDLLFC